MNHRHVVGHRYAISSHPTLFPPRNLHAHPRRPPSPHQLLLQNLVQLPPQVVRLRRRRTAARRCSATRCKSPPRSISSIGSRTRTAISWRPGLPGKDPQLEVVVDLMTEMTVVNPFAFFLQDEAIEYPFRYEDAVRMDLLPYLETLPVAARVQEFLAGVPRTSKKTVDFLVDLNRYVHNAVKYVIRKEPGVQTCEETLALRSGSCRDSAWLLVQVLRHLGLAARFVSGYLIQLKPDLKPLDGPPGPGSDFTDLHAWAEVYLPGAGWVGLDPTSACWRAKATCRWPPRPIRIRRRRFPAAWSRARVNSPSK